MCQFTPLTLFTLYIQMIVLGYYSKWVIPFGNPRIKGYLHLPEAYRS